MPTSDKLHHHLAFVVILTEASHIFCCVLPTLVTLISVLASFGVIAQVPVFMLDIHEALHAYELPIIGFSGLMLALGWVFYVISRRVECEKPHCEPHETICAPHKNTAHRVLQIASLIFALNILVYTTVHIHLEESLHNQAVTTHHDHHSHD